MPPSSSSPLSISFFSFFSTAAQCIPVPKGSASPPSLIPVVAPKRHWACLPTPPSRVRHSISPPSLKEMMKLPFPPPPAHPLILCFGFLTLGTVCSLPAIWYHTVSSYGKQGVAMTTVDSTCLNLFSYFKSGKLCREAMCGKIRAGGEQKMT